MTAETTIMLAMLASDPNPSDLLPARTLEGAGDGSAVCTTTEKLDTAVPVVDAFGVVVALNTTETLFRYELKNPLLIELCKVFVTVLQASFTSWKIVVESGILALTIAMAEKPK